MGNTIVFGSKNELNEKIESVALKRISKFVSVVSDSVKPRPDSGYQELGLVRTKCRNLKK